MMRPSWLGRAVRNLHRHAIEQASRRWRGGRRDDSARTRRKSLISTQVNGIWKAKSHSSEIRLDAAGNWLFVGNRGHDSLAVFAVTFDGATPRLRRAHVVKTGGACPRNFAVLESHVVVGNQDTNELVVFRREADGFLTEISRRAHRSPNFLAPLVAPQNDHQKTIGKCPSPRAQRSLAGVFVEPPPPAPPLSSPLRTPLRAVA